VLAIVKALAELVEANATEMAIREEIERGGASCSLQPSAFFIVGDPKDESSAVSHFVFDLVEAGTLPANNPFVQELRQLQNRR
jgi:hypothetical protein